MKKILIIDDDRDFIDVFKTRLEVTGYKVEGLTNPDEGRWSMRGDPPDLVILDLNMPGQSGFELLVSLPRQIGDKIIPVIVFTAREVPSDEAEVHNLGAAAFFVKGRDDKAIMEKIREILS